MVKQMAKHRLHGALPDAPQPLAPARLLALPRPAVDRVTSRLGDFFTLGFGDAGGVYGALLAIAIAGQVGVTLVTRQRITAGP